MRTLWLTAMLLSSVFIEDVLSAKGVNVKRGNPFTDQHDGFVELEIPPEPQKKIPPTTASIISGSDLPKKEKFKVFKDGHHHYDWIGITVPYALQLMIQRSQRSILDAKEQELLKTYTTKNNGSYPIASMTLFQTFMGTAKDVSIQIPQEIFNRVNNRQTFNDIVNQSSATPDKKIEYSEKRELFLNKLIGIYSDLSIHLNL